MEVKFCLSKQTMQNTTAYTILNFNLNFNATELLYIFIKDWRNALKLEKNVFLPQSLEFPFTLTFIVGPTESFALINLYM